MPDIKLKNQPFDLAFHPTESVVYTGLLTGEVKAFRYDQSTGESSTSWSVRPTKRTMRSVDTSHGGKSVWTGGKSGTLYQLDASSGTSQAERDGHGAPINRVACITDSLVVTGDDDGVIKFWDPRKEEAVRSFTHHFDYISDFAYFDDKHQLVTTSGDGHLSVIDIRSNKTTPLSVSDDQEDELLSIVPIKGGTKSVVGSTLGVLSIWNRAKGWQDCVDRIPGHPASVDAMVSLGPDIIATGSEDGMIRVLQVLPHKFLGVIATHEEYPIERMELDSTGKWLGSVSHDDCLKLTDVADMFEESGDEMDVEADSDDEAEDDEGEGDDGEEEEVDSDDSDEDMEKNKKKKNKKNALGDFGVSSRDNDKAFFDDL